MWSWRKLWKVFFFFFSLHQVLLNLLGQRWSFKVDPESSRLQSLYPQHRWCFPVSSCIMWKSLWNCGATVKNQTRCHRSGNHKISCPAWMCVWMHRVILEVFFMHICFFFHISGCDLAQVSVLCDLWPCVTQYSSSPTGSLSLNHRTADISSGLAHLYIDSTPLSASPLCLLLSSLLCASVFQGLSSFALRLPWTTSPHLWARQLSYTVSWLATRRPLCVGWRTMLQWCRSHDGSRTDPCLTDHASASATWTRRTRATSSV